MTLPNCALTNNDVQISPLFLGNSQQPHIYPQDGIYYPSSRLILLGTRTANTVCLGVSVDVDLLHLACQQKLSSVGLLIKIILKCGERKSWSGNGSNPFLNSGSCLLGYLIRTCCFYFRRLFLVPRIHSSEWITLLSPTTTSLYYASLET